MIRKEVLIMKNMNAFYACPYCETEYTEPAELARCILRCEEKKKAEEEKKKQEQLALEKEARKQEIAEKEEELQELLNKYIKDYGSYSTTRNLSIDPYSFWRMFL